MVCPRTNAVLLTLVTAAAVTAAAGVVASGPDLKEPLQPQQLMMPGDPTTAAAGEGASASALSSQPMQPQQLILDDPNTTEIGGPLPQPFCCCYQLYASTPANLLPSQLAAAAAAVLWQHHMRRSR
ncbi:hypothetical protein COO60DRAFT_839963 [Scenedesmus sp. NREL 46B-D3]|nr:hypothetical protein COO60DRAFT_839963 [Scenedesmus sp. NREL 46B-D3]